MVRKADLCSVGVGEDNSVLDTADTGAVTSDGETDVTLFTPDGVPGVLDEPVFLTVLGAVADGEDGVIEVGATGSRVEDTAGVSLPGGSVGLNEDGEGLLGESGLHLGDVAGEDGGDLLVSDAGAGDGGLARLGGGGRSGGVAVGSLGIGGVSAGVVLHGGCGPSTVATVGAVVSTVGAINELLLGEGLELSGSDAVSAFESSNGGESPA